MTVHALIVVSVIPGTDAAFNLLSLAIGVVVAPIIAIGLGPHIERAGESCARTCPSRVSLSQASEPGVAACARVGQMQA